MNPAQEQHFINHLTHLMVLSMEGQISESQFEELQKILTENPLAREYYYDFIASYLTINSMEVFSEIPFNQSVYLDQQLWDELAEAEATSPAITLPKISKEQPDGQAAPNAPTHKISKMSLISLITSAAAMLFVVLFARFAPVKGQFVVGKLADTIHARWEDPTGQINPGCDVFVGSMNLIEGLAEIVLDSGAIAVFEAPARFTLESAHSIYLQQGRLVIKINRASEEAFVVRSPHASIVDYGTEFGVQVDASFNTVAHVYQGKVELRSGSNPLRFEKSLALTPNQAGQADVLGQVSTEHGISERFIRPDEFDIRLKASKGSGYHRWLLYSQALRKDPSLAAYYTFEIDPGKPDVLVNFAENTAGDLNGKFYSAANADKPVWCQGRWPQKSALSFDRTQLQYVETATDEKLSINGPITIAAWIYCAKTTDGGHIVSNRIPPRSFCNYQLGYRSPSASEWMHNIHLARKLNSDDSKNQVCSKKLPDLSGWILVAATHDNETLKFYLNGSLVDTKFWPQKLESMDAPLIIGSDYAPGDFSRFNGKIDEILIAGRVFSEEEINQMYEAGRP